MGIKKKSNMMGILELVVMMGIVGYFLQFAKSLQSLITGYQEYVENFCTYEEDCILVAFTVFFFIMFLLQVYVAYLFKKQRKKFPVFFVIFFSLGLFSELAIYINESVMSSFSRLIFNGVFLLIFTLYLFYSAEGKDYFSD